MHLIFDFDGTLVNSFSCVMEKALLLADEFSLKKIHLDDIEDLRDLSSIEIIKHLNIPHYKVPKLITQMRKHLHHKIATLTPVPGIKDTLEQLHRAKFTLGILTSNSVENVNLWLETNNLHHIFSFVHASNYFSKKKLIKKTLTHYKIDPANAMYIGDETRDIDAAKTNNIISVAVTWGYNSEKALLKYQPSFIVKDPKDLLILSYQ